MAESTASIDERRLWIGNLDCRITEFQLLKILQKFGKIEKFDLLFHRSGPLVGQPRGYAFVTYKEIKEANRVLNKLNGKPIGSKTVAVRLAKNINYDEIERPKQRIEIPVLAAGSSSGTEANSRVSNEIAIQAIEAKLKLLENRDELDDFEINKTATHQIPLIKKYQYNKDSQSTTASTKLISKSRHKNGPYNRNHHRR